MTGVSGVPHDYITVGNRRWCQGCRTYQVLKNGQWRDSPDLVGPYPGYEATQADCPRDTPAAQARKPA